MMEVGSKRVNFVKNNFGSNVVGFAALFAKTFIRAGNRFWLGLALKLRRCFLAL